MNSFRVIDTRFRILKGGKIGLAMSIALIGGMLTLGSTDANAVDYFTDVEATISDSTTTPSGGINPITVQKAVNVNSVSLDSTRTANDTNPVVFKPTSWANSSYIDPIFTVAQTDPMYPLYPDRYLLKKEDFSSLELNLTFDPGATSGSISKNSTTFYNANITSPSYIADASGIPTQNLTTTNSTAYTANLIFNGSNTVSGSTNIDDGNIKLNGSVDFNGAVTAGSIDMDTTDEVIFGGNVSLSSGSGTLNFIQDGDILLNSNFSGNITTTTGNGNITTIGSNNISGSIGSFTNFLNSLNIGDSTTISNTTINENVFVDSTILNNTTTNSSTLIILSGKNITSTITTSHDNKGILTLSGGTQTVTGAVGTSGSKLANVNAGANGATSTFSNDVFATNLNVTGTGAVNLNGSYSGTTLNYNADGSVNLADNEDITSAITTTTNNTGTLALAGTSTVSGQVGTNANKLKIVNAGATGEIATFSNDVFATNLNVTGTGAVNLNGSYSGTTLNYNADGSVNLADNEDITSAITTTTNNTGTLALAGTSTVSGQVGTNANKLKIVNAGATGEIATFSNDVFATNLNVTGTGAVNLNGSYSGTTLNYNADGSVNLADNEDITSAITTTTNNTGTLALAGTSTVSGQVGTNANKLKIVNAGATGEIATFSNDVFATNLNVTGTGAVNLNGSYSGTTLNYNADGSVNLADNEDITSAITTTTNNTGTLALAGTSTVSGQVGTNANKLKIVNAGATGEIATFSNDVFATNLNVTGTGAVNLNGSYSGTTLNYNADGSVNLADNEDITSAITTTTNNTGTLALAGTSTVSGQVGTNANKLKIVNAGATGEIATFSNDVFATNLNVTGTGAVNLNGSYSGTTLNYNADGSVNLADNEDITSAITTTTNNTGTLALAGTSTVSGQVGTNANKLKIVNAGATGEIATFSNDVFATNLNVTGTGAVNLNGSYSGTTLNYNADGSVNLADNEDITSAITTTTNNTGTLALAGTSTVSGQVGTNANKLKIVNAGATGEIATFSNDVFATNTNIGSGEIKFEEDLTSDIIALTSNNGVVTFVGDILGNTQNVTGNIGSSGNLINTFNIGESGGTGKYSRTIIDGNVFATNTLLNNGVSNNSTLELTDGSNINSTITTSNDSQGVLTFLGDSIATGTIGTSTEKLAQINAGADAKIVTFNSSINSDNLNITGDGEIVLADNANINAPITTTTDNEGTLTFNGTSTVSGELGTSTEKLKEINAGVTGETVTFEDDVYATNTNIASGVVNFNTVSGTTNSNIVFTGNGTANLNEGITGDINFTGNNATVNISDGKGILGSVQTLASNNTGIINYKGDGTISGNVGSSIYGIKELNINTNNEQNTPEGVLVTSDALGRELYADLVALKNNATLTLADNVNIVNTGSDNIIITVDTNNTGVLTFQGNSNIEGEVGELTKVLNTINAGATGKTVTFDDMVYATNLKYSDDGKVVLNGDNSLNSANEAMIGTVDLDGKSGTLEIGDNVNLTTGTSGIQFANANDAVLEFAGNSTITGVLGGNTAGNSTFERIYAGADNKTVTFKNDVHVKEGDGTTLHVSGTGIVNFEGNLVGDLIYDANGTVNVNNGKSIIVTTVANAVKTTTNNTGILNFKGETTLYGDIGTSTNRLESVTFASEGTTTDSYTQIINKNIYAQNINIGNNSNQTTVNITEDTTFNGNLNLRSNSILNVDDYDVVVADNLDIASNSTLKFKVNATDLEGSASSTYGNYGSINSSSLTIDNNTKIDISYVGTLNGTDTYDLIRTSNIILTNYEGTELNGLVSDDSIVNSVVKNVGNNLVLFVDRTGGGSFAAEDLYIVKSEIGNHYSNGASQALAGYAKKEDRAGALTDIFRKMEELEGGLIVTAEKKEEMIKIQKLLAPVANNSTIKSSLVASTLALSTVGSRISDIRVSPNLDFVPYNYSGLSSGDYTLDTSFWIKALASKGTQNSVDQYDGYDTNSTGFVIGMDKTLNNGVILGLAAANLNTKIDQADFRAGDDSDTKTMQIMAYGAYEFEDTYVDGLLSYAKHSTDGTRTANSGKVSSSVDADQISAKVEVGHRVYLEDIATLTPFASVEYGTLNQKAYSEKGTAYQNDALKVDSVKLNKGTVGVGAKISTNLSVGNTIIIPEAKLAVYNSFGDTKADVKAQYVGGGNKFVTPTQELNDTTYNAGFSIKTSLSESTSLMLGVDYDRSKDGSFEGYSGNVAFKLSF